MRLKLMCKRLTALILAVLMVLSTFPMAVYAEEMASDVANATDTVTDFTVTENEPSVTEPGNSEMPMLKEAEDEEALPLRVIVAELILSTGKVWIKSDAVNLSKVA